MPTLKRYKTTLRTSKALKNSVFFYDIIGHMKRLFLLLISLVLLGACTSNEQLEAKYEAYRSKYQNLLNSTSFLEQSNHFNIEAKLSTLSSGEYRYDVYVDNAKIAMYDLEILVIVDEGLLVISDEMMPNIGIYDDLEYAMVPYQINIESGYVKGFNLNGTTTQKPIVLKVSVSWKDYFKIKSTQEIFRFELN